MFFATPTSIVFVSRANMGGIAKGVGSILNRRISKFHTNAMSCSKNLSHEQQKWMQSEARTESLMAAQKNAVRWGAFMVGGTGLVLGVTSLMGEKNNDAIVDALENPRPLVLCGPSGSGKSTLMKKLMAEFPNAFEFSISHTTRGPRPGEVNGVDYHYVSRDKMKAEIAQGKFVEHAEFAGNMYGTSKQSIKDVAKKGKICILDIDVQGVKSLKQTDLNPLYVFIEPPSIAILEKRLRGRGTETEDKIQKRLDTAKSEIEFSKTKGAFHCRVLNNDLETAYSQLRAIVLSTYKLNTVGVSKGTSDSGINGGL
eukprot:Nk52_evm26s370 gene=Nk52_evmTU26s370